MNKHSRIQSADLLNDGLDLIQKLEATLHQWSLLQGSRGVAGHVSRADAEAVDWMHQCLDDLSATIGGMQHHAARADGRRKIAQTGPTDLVGASGRAHDLQQPA